LEVEIGPCFSYWGWGLGVVVGVEVGGCGAWGGVGWVGWVVRVGWVGGWVGAWLGRGGCLEWGGVGWGGSRSRFPRARWGVVLVVLAAHTETLWTSRRPGWQVRNKSQIVFLNGGLGVVMGVEVGGCGAWGGVGWGGWYGWSGWVGGWVGVGWVEWGGWGRVPAVVCSSPSLQFLPTFFCSLQFFQLGSLQLVLSRSSVMGKGSKSGPSGFEELNTERKATSIVKHLHAAKTTYLIWALRCRANPAFRLYRKSDPTKIALKVTAEDAGLLFRGVTIYLRGVFAPLFIQVGLPPPSSAWWGFRTPLYPGGIAAPRFILGVPPPPQSPEL
jgi:hypothetical protein